MKENIVLKGGMVVLFFLFSIAHTTTLRYVHPDSALNSIQAALDTCASGDIVLVAAGTYNENIVWPDAQGLMLMSAAGPTATILDGNTTGSVIVINTGVDSTTVISGFTIQNGNAYSGGGIYISDASPTISNNIITNNIADGYDSGGGGIYLYNSSTVMAYNTIKGNTADSMGGGIFYDVNCSGTVKNNIIYGNTAVLGGGIFCKDCSPIIIDNTIAENTADTSAGGIGADLNAQPTITNNIIFGNIASGGEGGGGGIGTGLGCWPFINNNMIMQNRSNYGGGGIACYDASITNNTITANQAPYGGGLVCGQNSSPTITSNTINDNYAAGHGGGIILDNNCSASITGNIIDGNRADYGAGIGVGICSPTITSNIITSNDADDGGAGIMCYEFSTPTIDSCAILGNIGTGGDGVAAASFASVDIHYCDIINNTGYGVLKSGFGGSVNAEYNFWGDASGPGGEGPGSGDEVSSNVDYDPWLSTSVRDSVIPSSPYVANRKSGNDIILAWHPITTDTLGNPETVNYYVVYRNTEPSFIPSPSDSIGGMPHPDTSYTDEGVLDSLDSYHYLVKAVDWTYNKSKKSNMGYKFNRTLIDNSPTATNRNWVSLPYNSGYTVVSDLVTDLSASGDPVTKVTNLRDDQLYESYRYVTFPAPHWEGIDFAIIPGRSYEMVTKDGAVDPLLVLVGSNEPDSVVHLIGNVDATNRNWVSIPYNAVYSTVSDITSESFAGGDPVTKITNLRDDQLYESYRYVTFPVPHWEGVDFAIIPGRGYEFVTKDGVTDTTWNPTEWSNEAGRALRVREKVPKPDIETLLGSLTEPDRAPVWLVEESKKKGAYADARVYRPVSKRLVEEVDYREPGISHIVCVHSNVKEFDDLVFTAYRLDRPFDVLTENVIGCGVTSKDDFHSLWFDVGNFKRPWKDGEEVILIIEALKQGRGYFSIVKVKLDYSVDIQNVAYKITFISIPDPVNSKEVVRWDGIDNGHVVGYSLYKGEKRLNDKVITAKKYSALGKVHLKPVIIGGYETVYSSQNPQSSTKGHLAIAYAFNTYPNPFTKKTSIHYAVAHHTPVDITVYDAAGRQVKTLVSEKHEPGYYQTHWFGDDEVGRKVAAGIYFIEMNAKEFESQRKVIFVH